MSSTIFSRTKDASRALSVIDDARRNAVLLRLADAIVAESAGLLEANAADLAAMDRSNPLYDRLMLTEERLKGIASDMRHVAALPSPLGRTLVERTLPNGLRLRKVSVPFGVIGVIYEARPNVTFDVFSLCFKSGNACLLKGGRDADASNRAAVALIKRILESEGIDPDAVNPEGSLFISPNTESITNPYLAKVRQAGAEYKETERISDDTQTYLDTPMLPAEAFVKTVNEIFESMLKK